MRRGTAAARSPSRGHDGAGRHDLQRRQTRAGANRRRHCARSGLLVRREHSRPELARKLAARGVAADEAAAAIDKMTAAGWQDDTRFAISLARTRAGSGYGPLRIRAELATHRLAPEAIAAAFAALAEAGEDDWPALARDLVRRRLGPGVSADANAAAQGRRLADAPRLRWRQHACGDPTGSEDRTIRDGPLSAISSVRASAARCAWPRPATAC